MIKLRLLLTIALLMGVSAYAQQQKHTISGEIRDDKTGETTIGAAVQIKELNGTGTTSNAYGFFSITLPEGKYTLIIRYIGYKTDTQTVMLTKNVKLNIRLNEASVELGVVEIEGEKKNQNVSENRMSVEKLDMKDISTIPVLFGEKDILKTIQLLPGVTSTGEGGSGFVVRGGSPDQNLVLIDEAPVYNASHLLGFFSTFNSDALKDVTLYKGAIPAEYGGRQSSVLDVKMKDGNNQRFGTEGGIGLISSRLLVEGPIIKNKSSFIVSGRRTYVDQFFRFSSDTTVQKSGLYFYDLNLKANYTINDKNRIFLSGYFGRDDFNLAGLIGFSWGNGTGTLRWNHIFNDRLFSNTSLIYSKYDYKFSIALGTLDFAISSSIEDVNVKQDFQYYINSTNTLKFGVQGIYHRFVPGRVSTNGSFINAIEVPMRRAYESGIYLSNDQNVGDRLKLMYGARLSMFNHVGKQDVLTYDVDGNVTDSAHYNFGQIIKTHVGFEPRLGITYILNEENSVKASYNRAFQYLHLLSNSTSGNPTDLWVPSTNNVMPGIADQVAVGYFRNFLNNKFEASAEVYYKWMQNQIDYKPGADLFLNDKVESQLIYGIGRAYGLELYLKKKRGIINGWISYTLGKSKRSFAAVDNGEWFNSRYDRTHTLNIVTNYQLNEHFTFSATFVFYTGNAVTFPHGRYFIDGHIIPLYSKRNADRFPAYHRMDLGVTWYFKKHKRFEHNLNLGIYNVYGRENAYQITFQEAVLDPAPNPTDPNKTEAVQTSLFRFVPAITYNFKF